jgi:RHS repeat-associated protein
MKTDANKGITSIVYNHLNLPTEIKFNNSNTKKINYTYDATGIKLRKVVNDNGSITTTDYTNNGAVYENNVLQFIPTAEGYVTPTANGYRYVYNYVDNLGNIRLSYSDSDNNGSVDSSEILEENNYYPGGLKHKGYNNVITGTDHPYGFGGMEEQDELGLEWLDFGARNYDPALMRWMNIDPLADKYVYNSTYAFAENKVVKYNELEGLEVTLNKFDRLSYSNKSWLGKAATFVGNAGISIVNGAIDTFNYAGDLDRADQAAGGFGQGAGTKILNDTKSTVNTIIDYTQNTTFEEFGGDVKNTLSKTETYENIAGAIIASAAISKINKLGSVSKGPKISFSKLAETGKINPAKVRFSQNSIKSVFKKGGGSVEDLTKALKNGTISPDDIPAIKITEIKGEIFTLDNRRLKAFQDAGIDIKYEKVDFNSLSKKDLEKFTTTNGGTSIEIRGQ